MSWPTLQNVITLARFGGVCLPLLCETWFIWTFCSRAVFLLSVVVQFLVLCKLPSYQKKNFDRMASRLINFITYLEFFLFFSSEYLELIDSSLKQPLYNFFENHSQPLYN